MFPLEFRAEVNHEETRVMGLSYSEDPMIVAGVVLTWYQSVTDGRTESIIANTALCVESYADALKHVKIDEKLLWRACKELTNALSRKIS